MSDFTLELIKISRSFSGVEVLEATAISNVLMQAIGLNHLESLVDARDVVRTSFTPEVYEPRQTPGWEEAYSRLQKEME